MTTQERKVLRIAMCKTNLGVYPCNLDARCANLSSASGRPKNVFTLKSKEADNMNAIDIDYQTFLAVSRTMHNRGSRNPVPEGELDRQYSNFSYLPVLSPCKVKARTSQAEFQLSLFSREHALILGRLQTRFPGPTLCDPVRLTWPTKVHGFDEKYSSSQPGSDFIGFIQRVNRFKLLQRELKFQSKSLSGEVKGVTFSCNTLSMSSCNVIQKKHEGIDIVKLPNPRQGQSRYREWVQKTKIPVSKLSRAKLY
ncbi:LOW QUALITY PROTEIN: hypothetical protein T265_14471 [Opisthorchis viverrini]|uniref:Uncharacterized protein n=1 Tax=Opisthorchis viverrini TaxID=6198 RepID=A0A074ZEZ7_OPIVI|nr:LOW QUALITY PROTEIN: hypothetical protein T265_14471 [Opisthorchis viverrini]KER24197.1 LOW QUALITY PROTEIN: hypothetical protein T265_14471 [Opisthorchis viverrini]